MYLQSDIQGSMFTSSPANKDGLVVMYNFAQSEIKNIGSAAGEVGKVFHISCLHTSPVFIFLGRQSTSAQLIPIAGMGVNFRFAQMHA